jgi:FAD/FMN-containing dehydrogenase
MMVYGIDLAALEHGRAPELMKQVKRVFDPRGILNPGQTWE